MMDFNLNLFLDVIAWPFVIIGFALFIVNTINQEWDYAWGAFFIATVAIAYLIAS